MEEFSFGREDVVEDSPEARPWKVFWNGELQGTVVGNNPMHVKHKMYFGLTDIEPRAGKWTVE